jgi:hypothetical protein
MENATPCQRQQRNIQNFKRTNFLNIQPRRTRHQRWRPLQPVDPARTLLASSLPHRSLARCRFFHLGAHRVQIVSSRDHRKQQNQYTSQSQQTLQRTQPALRTRAPPPQPVSRQRQQNPHEIKKQLHHKRRKAKRASESPLRIMPVDTNSNASFSEIQN